MAGGAAEKAARIMMAECSTARLLPDGRRLYLSHGPIDLVIEAFGEKTEVHQAYAQAFAVFPSILPGLAEELSLLRRPIDEIDQAPRSPVARRMVAACRSHAPAFVTPMAAVAGAVAEYVLEHMIAGRHLSRAYVNNGGDIAVHLGKGQSFACGLVPDLHLPSLCGQVSLSAERPARGIATSGRACSGQGGRSFSLGIADAVTVVAITAAAADVAATLIANAVDLPVHPSIVRVPARDLDPDSDLRMRPVTVDLGPLSPDDVCRALRRGEREAARLRAGGLIDSAALVLRHRYAVIGQPITLIAA
ncbi:MAG: UPF0280 family protein [Alphaproteobacteria bacterium]